MPTCPNGHESSAFDRCSHCGAALGGGGHGGGGHGPRAGAAVGRPRPGAHPPPTARCPNPACGEPTEDTRYCESCGHALDADEPHPDRRLRSDRHDPPDRSTPAVVIHVGADRTLYEHMVEQGEVFFPEEQVEAGFSLSGDRVAVGRQRDGHPVDLDDILAGQVDPAVSRGEHCVFERRGTMWVVRDAGSTNGTRINAPDRVLFRGQEHVLRDGDRILLGAWTRLTVEIRSG